MGYLRSQCERYFLGQPTTPTEQLQEARSYSGGKYIKNASQGIFGVRGKDTFLASQILAKGFVLSTMEKQVCCFPYQP